MMVAAAVALSSDGSTLTVSGILDTETVPCLSHAADQFITTAADPVFDLQAVTKAESAALALLTMWRRQAHRLGKTVRFIHVPQHLMDIACLSNVEEILGLS